MDEMRLSIRRISDKANIPAYAHAGDAGLDLVSVDSLLIDPGERALVHCGFSMALPEGYCGLVLPRSGLAAKHGITVLNAPGLIDAGYRGEICVVLLNTDKQQSFKIEPGMRIAQLMIMEAPPVVFDEVEQLDITSRNEGGFGSSGITELVSNKTDL